MFMRRLYWKFTFPHWSKAKLHVWLTKPDKDLADLAWRSYVAKVHDLRELMVIVYDDHHQFDDAVRETAGKLVLRLLREPFGPLLHLGVNWLGIENGRMAYVAGVCTYLPQLVDEARVIVDGYFFSHEKEAFNTHFPYNTRRAA